MSVAASVTLRTPDDTIHQLAHGDIIGRMWSAALCLDHPGVSEAHALVSLRGGVLKLLALRGLFTTQQGKPAKELTLEIGQRITLTRGLALDVIDVELPTWVWQVSSEQLGQHTLASVSSVQLRPMLRLLPGARQDAAAVFYFGAEGWRVRTGDTVEPLADGWSLEVPGHLITVQRRPLSTDEHKTGMVGRVDAPLRITTRFDSVIVEREGQPALRLTGVPARMISTLAEIDTAMHWEALARDLWAEPIDAQPLRKRFDAVLRRLRHKLKAAGVRTDLIRSDHSGLFELVIHELDQLIEDNG
ncbi:MAG: hypothetical protein AB8H79_23975 [Myxococcota bacterium]